MANLVACFAMSHAPQLMLAPDRWNLLRMREAEKLPITPITHRRLQRGGIQFGRALAEAIRRYPVNQNVIIVGSGGLSHTIIDEPLDHRLLEIVKCNDVDAMALMPPALFVEGTSEILNWIVTAAAADRSGTVFDYQPLYRAPTGVGCAMGFAYWNLL